MLCYYYRDEYNTVSLSDSRRLCNSENSHPHFEPGEMFFLRINYRYLSKYAGTHYIIPGSEKRM